MVSDKVDFLAGNCMGAMKSPACSCVSITLLGVVLPLTSRVVLSRLFPFQILGNPFINELLNVAFFHGLGDQY